MKIRVIIADDHSVVLEGLRHILEETGCEVVGTADEGHAVVQLACELKPHIVTLDITMPGLNGVEAARQIRKNDPHVKLIFVTMHPDAVYVREAFRAGANAYLLKRTVVSEVKRAIGEVMEGRYYITPLVAQQSMTELFAAPDFGAFGKELTPRQREVLQLVAEGRTAKEIGSMLSISIKTVEFHKRAIMDSLGLHTIAELSRYAMEHKIVGT
jgi:DNA-binding NarL/FixJ family response regulator